MENLYNATETGLTTSTDVYYNGNISAIKWKGVGAATGAADQKSYKFTYDKSNKLKAATSQGYTGSAWTKETGALNESMTYDHNGNILSLLRSQRKHQLAGIVPSYTAGTIDDLTYTYDANLGDQLLKVTDAAITSAQAGFDNGTSSTNNDYLYDTNGNLTKDLNKGISTIAYNLLGKPTVVTFTDGRHVDYVYDAAGTKLSMKTYNTSNVLQSTTDYANGFVYENNNLSYFSSPEGRVVNNSGTLEYQYAITDQQGNTRVVFSSVNPTTAPITATFEDAVADGQVFQNVNTSSTYWVSKTAANNTNPGQYVLRMNNSYTTGPAKTVKVFPGDVLDLEVYAYYEGSTGFGSSNQPLNTLITSVAAAFGGVSGAGGESGQIYSRVNNAFGAFGSPVNEGDAAPTAHLNYILFDKDYNLLNMGWKVVPTTANMSKQKVSFGPINIKEVGYIYVYLTYGGEGTNWVYFDDLKITQTKTNVIQYNEYYPYGLQANTSWTRDNTTKNDFLYNAGSELNTTTGWYETMFRNYDAALGRFTAIDPLATKFASQSAYHYGAGNPIMFNDPTGAEDYAYGGDPYGGGFNPGPGYAQSLAQASAQAIAGQAAEWEIIKRSIYSSNSTTVTVNGVSTQMNFSSIDEVYTYSSAMASGIVLREVEITATKFSDYGMVFSGEPYRSPSTWLHNRLNEATFDYGDWLKSQYHDGLDVVGIIPGIGEVADGINAIGYAIEGDYVNAGISTAAMVPFIGWGATGSKVVLKTLPWSSKSLAKSAKLLESGASSVSVGSKAHAEELFMGLYQGGNGKAFINTTGLNAVETKSLFGTKAGTYHWDLNDTMHGGIPHLQIHDFDGSVTRIFFNH